MFKPKYSTQDLNDALTRIERLHRLYEQTEQYIRLNGQKMDETLLQTFADRQVMYNRNIDSAQRYLQAITEKAAK